MHQMTKQFIIRSTRRRDWREAKTREVVQALHLGTEFWAPIEEKAFWIRLWLGPELWIREVRV